jgi:dynein heavy chain
LTIEGKLFPSRKDAKITLKPPAGKKLIVFIDDINMPSKEEYGAQPPIELLRLFQDKKGFFDRTQHFWKDVKVKIILF